MLLLGMTFILIVFTSLATARRGNLDINHSKKSRQIIVTHEWMIYLLKEPHIECGGNLLITGFCWVSLYSAHTLLVAAVAEVLRSMPLH